MKISKGDLVLIKGIVQTYSCIVLSDKYSMGSGNTFYYSYCIETGIYGVIYSSEIISIAAKDFDPEHKFSSELFNDEYNWYQVMMEQSFYWPYVFTPDDSEEDSDDNEK